MPVTPFHALYSNGFRHLLPIIPPDGAISPHSPSLRDRPDHALGKIPGLRREAGWVGFSDWQTHEVVEGELDAWQDWGAGVGLRCHDVVAIDIDVMHEALADLIEMEALTHLGIAPSRVGRAPKRLLLYRQSTPGEVASKRRLAFRDWADGEHMVEVLGAVQQFVVDGLHPVTGKRYTWNEHPAEIGLDGLTEVSVEEVDTFLAAVADALPVYDCTVGRVESGGTRADSRPSETLVTQDIDLLQRVVAGIPNDESRSREFFVSMAHAIHAAAGADLDWGREVFLDWAARWPEGQREGEPERVYDSVRESTIGIAWLMDRAREAGMDTCWADFDADVIEPQPLSLADPSAVDGWAPEGKGHPVLDRYVYVRYLKRYVDLEHGMQWDKEQFNDLFPHGLGEGKPCDWFIKTAADHNLCDTVDYVPGNPARTLWDGEKRVLNGWRPGPAYDGQWTSLAEKETLARVPAADWETRVGPWLELARHLFPDDKARGHLFDWMAHLLQCPGVKPHWHPVIGSDYHGLGKDSIFVPLEQALGDNCTTIGTGDLEGQWTWWAENVQLVVASEISSFERKSVMNKLKRYTAAPPYKIDINKKGMPQYEAPNLFGMVAFTNEQDALGIQRHDRRFFVLWSEAEPKDATFYIAYYDWLAAGGAAEVARFLMGRDISQHDAKGSAPSTEAKEEMRRAAMPVNEGLLLEAIESEEGVFAGDIISSGEVRDWLKAQGARVPSPQQVGVWLRKVGARCLGQVRSPEGKARLWSIRRHEMLSAQAESEGVSAVRATMMQQRERLGLDLGDFMEEGRQGSR